MNSVKVLSSALVLGVGVLLSSSVFAADYTLDKAHSTISFSAKHLMVSKTTGSFSDYDGTISFDPNDLVASKIEITVKAASIDTRNEKRDEHLKGADFLDAEKFPAVTFVSKSIAKEGDAYTLTGDLTLKGVTKEITVPAEISGPVTSPMGGTAIGINANFKVNRQDYGVSFNKTLDNGGLMVSDDVNLDVSLEAYAK
ncbi:MAG: polyisoprenoid-binding protein [Candidatus Omnitrophica bacterium]|nr:polyisoprenoid-binding protein [Candidatus Omnitrophota bacterium]